jgi:phosphoribosylformylglycinamidine synthase
MVMADTIQRPGGDAAVLRVHGTTKGLAVTTDCTPRYVKADPKAGGAQAVAEAWRNITATGAKPLAITDCMNFANPERPRIMGQFAGAIEGMIDACTILEFPVISGNVSLYNETNGEGILPTPAIGAVGLLADISTMATIALKEDGNRLYVVGDTAGHMGQSLYLREISGREEGPPPPVDLAIERRNGDFVRSVIEAGQVRACHDISDGGLLVAAAEMALSGNRGVDIHTDFMDLPSHAALFGEDQGRYLVEITASDAAAFEKAAQVAGVPVATIGTVGGDALTVEGSAPISLTVLRDINESWLPRYMENA